MDSSKSSEAIVTIDVHTAKELLDSSNYRYLDVRTIEEFNKSHVENAINVTYMFKTPEGKLKNSEFLEQLSAVCSKDDQLIVGCNSGGRSFLACGDLLEAGYTKVRNMEGGYSAWVDKGFAGNEKPEEELKTVCKFRP